MKLIELIAQNYPEGTRVKLARAREGQIAKVGDFGTVTEVTDNGDIIVLWDNLFDGTPIISEVKFRQDIVIKIF